MPRLTYTHWFALLLGISSAFFQAANLMPTLRYDRVAILDGQWWRLITGNLVHLGWSHLFLNLAGLAIICYLVSPALRAWQWLIVLTICFAGVGAGLLMFNPELSWYVGLSGALYGLLIAGAIADFSANRWMATVLIVYTIAKIGHEQFYGAASASEVLAGGKVIVNAHLFGMISGVIAVAGVLILSRDRLWQASPDRSG